MKTVKVDKRNRIYITSLVEHTEINIENGEVAIHPNAVTGIIYDPERGYDEIIRSLKSHIVHFEMLEEIEKRKEIVAVDER